MNDRRFDLAALDMDGTLLNSDHATTPFTRAALERADAAGKVIALCTGRCMSELWRHLRSLPGVSYVIGENGGCLYDVRAGRVLRQSAIADGDAERLLALAGRYDVLVQCFIGGQSWIQAAGPDGLEHWHMGDFAPVFAEGSRFDTDLASVWRESGLPMEKINLYFARAEDRDDCGTRFDGMDLRLAPSLGIGFELSPPDATKAAGLRALCEHLGIPVSHAMAVGDGGNDLDLMQAAGFSVAMGNAVDAVRAAADAVTDDCDHDGAAKALIRYMLGDV